MTRSPCTILHMNIELPSLESEKPLPGLESYVEDFLASRVKEVEVLRNRIQDEEYDKIIQIAHDWKSFCHPYGFATLGILAKSLAEAAANKHLGDCLKCIEFVAKYLESKHRIMLSGSVDLDIC